ncbi:MAG: hypothetical protein QXW38_08325 [Candidatus Nitrosotenuis sp.]
MTAKPIKNRLKDSKRRALDEVDVYRLGFKAGYKIGREEAKLEFIHRLKKQSGPVVPLTPEELKLEKDKAEAALVKKLKGYVETGQ